MENQETLATEILHELKASAKRWFIAFLIVLALWFSTIGAFVWYLSLPVDCESREYHQRADGASINNIVGGDYIK